MRLASKIFLTSALVIVVLAGVGILSLRAVDRLASVNRDITTQTVPALHLATSIREALVPLARIGAHSVVLGDPRYAGAWVERADRVAADLQHLAGYAQSPGEVLHLEEAGAAFERYRRAVVEEQALHRLGGRATPVRLNDTDTPALIEQVQDSLDGLMEAMHTRVLAVQAEAARLETLTWTGVLVALGAAVGLALLGAGVIAHRMRQSLGQLSSAAADVASGAFREPIAVTSRDEIGALTQSFNEMGSELRRMEETRQEFFATVAHELRSPLTSIRSAVDLLHEEMPGPLTDKQGRLVDIISTSSGGCSASSTRFSRCRGSTPASCSSIGRLSTSPRS